MVMSLNEYIVLRLRKVISMHVYYFLVLLLLLHVQGVDIPRKGVAYPLKVTELHILSIPRSISG